MHSQYFLDGEIEMETVGSSEPRHSSFCKLGKFPSLSSLAVPTQLPVGSLGETIAAARRLKVCGPSSSTEGPVSPHQRHAYRMTELEPCHSAQWVWRESELGASSLD